MEVCGTHTVSIFRSGVKSLLPENITMLSGPGCPVCVTSQGYIDTALDMTRLSDVVVCTYGDMVRVPGRSGSLENMRANGADIKIMYSVRDVLNLAEKNPEKSYVWLGVGFETTAPTSAAAIIEAEKRGIENFFVLGAHKLALPAMSLLLSAGDVPIDGFLCPGHVSVIIGSKAYSPITEGYGKPCTIAGFEPVNMLEGILSLLLQIKEGRSDIENVYGLAVTESGNKFALQSMEEVFAIEDSIWRAIGTLPDSGLELKGKYRKFDAAEKFNLTFGEDYEPAGCKCGQVIQGKLTPKECALFGTSCTPQAPIGPCMVSSEGTCAAWYKYGQNFDESRRRI
jgi:hydrogenase expression/formation protein HypD